MSIYSCVRFWNKCISLIPDRKEGLFLGMHFLQLVLLHHKTLKIQLFLVNQHKDDLTQLFMVRIFLTFLKKDLSVSVLSKINVRLTGGSNG